MATSARRMVSDMAWPWKNSEPQVIGREPIYPAVAVIENQEGIGSSPEPVGIPSSGPVRKPTIEGDELAEYMRVAAEIGLDSCTDLTREKLLSCLRDEGIHVYKIQQVVAYLDQELGNDWEWRGLRSIDTAHMPGGGWGHTVGDRRIAFAAEPYRGAVPLPVLLTVQKIQKVMGDEVYFYVSAPKDNNGDPFLMVTSRWLSVYVVERWNEPGFRER